MFSVPWNWNSCHRHYELTHTLKTRRVYVASDDPKVEKFANNFEMTPFLQVLGECRKKYPDIEFLGDQVSFVKKLFPSLLFILTPVQNVAKSAAVSSRYTDSSLRGVIQDIHMLSISDFLVCTFSSQVSLSKYITMFFNLIWVGVQNCIWTDATASCGCKW